MTQGERDGQTGKGTRRSGRIIGHVLAARPPIDRTLQDCPFAVERTDPINRAVEVAHRWKGSVMPLARDAGVRAAIAASDSNPHGGGGTDGEHHEHHQERTEKGPTRVAGSRRPEANGDAGLNHAAAASHRAIRPSHAASHWRSRSISPRSSGMRATTTSAARATGRTGGVEGSGGREGSVH